MDDVAIVLTYEGKDYKPNMPSESVESLMIPNIVQEEDNAATREEAELFPPEETTLASRLKSIRTDHHLSVKSMAESVFLTPSVWTSLEKGEAVPSRTIPWYLHCIYHVREEWIESGTGEKYEAGYRPGIDELGKCLDYSEKLKADAARLIEELKIRDLGKKDVKAIMKGLKR